MTRNIRLLMYCPVLTNDDLQSPQHMPEFGAVADECIPKALVPPHLSSSHRLHFSSHRSSPYPLSTVVTPHCPASQRPPHGPPSCRPPICSKLVQAVREASKTTPQLSGCPHPILPGRYFGHLLCGYATYSCSVWSAPSPLTQLSEGENDLRGLLVDLGGESPSLPLRQKP